METHADKSTETKLIIIPIEHAEKAIEQATVLLDIREPDEFEQGHIKGAINIPRGMLEFKLGEVPELNSPEAKIIMYCKEGKRCVSAALTLIKMGYKHVYSLEGGLNAWLLAGNPLYQPSK